MTVIDLPSDFYFPDRQGFALDAIVLHTTQGTDSRTWLTKTGGVSANYLVQGDTVYRLVTEERPAWHAGDVVGVPTTPLYNAHGHANPNLWTVGIEIEGYAAGPIDPVAVQAVVFLIKDIRARNGPLPLIDHRELSPGNRTDPGIWRAAIDKALEDDVAFKDDPDAQAYVKDVRDTFEAVKAVINQLSVQVPAIKAEADLALARIDKLHSV